MKEDLRAGIAAGIIIGIITGAVLTNVLSSPVYIEVEKRVPAEENIANCIKEGGKFIAMKTTFEGLKMICDLPAQRIEY